MLSRTAAARRTRARAPRHFAWLLWLALLLPLAQTAAACHLYSHTGDAAAGAAELGKGKHAAGMALCDLCLAGSTVHGGGPPAAPLQLLLQPGSQPAPDAILVSPWEPPLALAYQGRAPPIALS